MSCIALERKKIHCGMSERSAAIYLLLDLQKAAGSIAPLVTTSLSNIEWVWYLTPAHWRNFLYFSHSDRYTIQSFCYEKRDLSLF